jgi:hypothetical protein
MRRREEVRETRLPRIQRQTVNRKRIILNRESSHEAQIQRLNQVVLRQMVKMKHLLILLLPVAVETHLKELLYQQFREVGTRCGRKFY